jgi:SH3-like domain-containing protein
VIPFVYRDLPLPSLLSWRSLRRKCLRRGVRRRLQFSVAILVCLALAGCDRFKPKPKTEIVYVLAKETFLRDRVAAVSNRVAMVQNGERLELLERGKRFLRVKTEKGETGWIEEHAVVNPEVVTGFAQLQKAHEHDPVVATATLRDDGYLHLRPGRDTDRFYLLPESDKLQLLLRASVPKAIGPQASGTTSSFATTQAAAAATKKSARAKAAQKQADEKKPPAPAVSFTPAPPPPQPESASNPQPAAEAAPAVPPIPAGPIPMEDWWLVRDSQGKVGWLMSRRIDVDVPDAIAGYAEGQRIVAAYVLRTVDDPGSDFPDKQAPEYVTVLNPYEDGLPYDFSQVRVFTWSLKKHRYETAFRQRGLQGYLPLIVATETFEKGTEPTFQFKQGIGDSVTIDPDTGATRPASTETLTYRLDNTVVKKVGAERPATPAVSAGGAAQTSPLRSEKASKSKHRRHKH